jgi:hypothetical protein
MLVGTNIKSAFSRPKNLSSLIKLVSAQILIRIQRVMGFRQSLGVKIPNSVSQIFSVIRFVAYALRADAVHER